MRLQALAKALDDFLERVEKKDPDWKEFHHIADRTAPEMEEAFLKAVARLQGKLVLEKVEAALARGDREGALKAIDWSLFEAEASGAIVPAIMLVLSESGAAAARQLGEKLKLRLSFDLRNPAAEEWIKKHTGELIKEITEESRRAIRAIILDAFERGGHPYETARKIRQYIGLTERDALAVLNYWRRITETGLRTPRQTDEMAETYAKRLLRRRAENIARTETIAAANAGQQLLWEDAAKKGLIDKRALKEWIVTPDDRLCPICAAMKGEKVPLNENFSGGVPHPPRHPSCRCAMGLVEV